MEALRRFGAEVIAPLEAATTATGAREPTMTVSTTTDQLFSPFDVGGLHLPNRIVMPAMGTGLPEHDGTCNDATIAYYGAAPRAASG